MSSAAGSKKHCFSFLMMVLSKRGSGAESEAEGPDARVCVLRLSRVTGNKKTLSSLIVWVSGIVGVCGSVFFFFFFFKNSLLPAS